MKINAASLSAAATIVLLGSVSYYHLDLNLTHFFHPPVVSIVVSHPGLSAQEMENKVTIPIEKGVQGIINTQHLYSITTPGKSEVYLYLSSARDKILITNKVRTQIDRIVPSLPRNISTPSITIEKGKKELPDLILFIHSPTKKKTDSFLINGAQEIPTRLSTLPEVGWIKVLEPPENEHTLVLDREKLISADTNPEEVVNAIYGSIFNYSSGTIQIEERNIPVRITTESITTEQLLKIPLVGRGGKIIPALEHLGYMEIEPGEKKQHIIVNGKSGVGIYIGKREGKSTFAFYHSLYREIASIKRLYSSMLSLEILFPVENIFIEIFKKTVLPVFIGAFLFLFIMTIIHKDIAQTSSHAVLLISVTGAVIFCAFLLTGNYNVTSFAALLIITVLLCSIRPTIVGFHLFYGPLISSFFLIPFLSFTRVYEFLGKDQLHVLFIIIWIIPALFMLFYLISTKNGISTLLPVRMHDSNNSITGESATDNPSLFIYLAGIIVIAVFLLTAYFHFIIPNNPYLIDNNKNISDKFHRSIIVFPQTREPSCVIPKLNSISAYLTEDTTIINHWIAYNADANPLFLSNPIPAAGTAKISILFKKERPVMSMVEIINSAIKKYNLNALILVNSQAWNSTFYRKNRLKSMPRDAKDAGSDSTTPFITGALIETVSVIIPNPAIMTAQGINTHTLINSLNPAFQKGFSGDMEVNNSKVPIYVSVPIKTDLASAILFPYGSKLKEIANIHSINEPKELVRSNTQNIITTIQNSDSRIFIQNYNESHLLFVKPILASLFLLLFIHLMLTGNIKRALHQTIYIGSALSGAMLAAGIIGFTYASIWGFIMTPIITSFLSRENTRAKNFQLTGLFFLSLAIISVFNHPLRSIIFPPVIGLGVLRIFDYLINEF